MIEHEPCTYVREEVGSSPTSETMAILNDPQASEVVEDIINKIVSAHLVDHGQFGTPRGYLRYLQCPTCKIASECPVKKELEIVDSKLSVLKQLFLSLSPQAPRWVKFGLANLSGIDPEALDDPGTWSGGYTDDSSNDVLIDPRVVHEFNAGIERVKKGQAYTKENLPELNEISAISENVQLPSVTITTNSGDTFIVVNAIDEVGFTEAPLHAKEYGILYGKLLNKMLSKSSSGRSSVMEPDNIMQKVINPVQGGTLNEIRMGGKNRLYFTVCDPQAETSSPTAKQPTRIVLLGEHGGDSAIQQKFLTNLRRKI